MLRPVLDPVLSREILARYTTFAGSVGAPAPMEHLAPAAAAQPARYETYVENLHQVTQAIRKNYLINLQLDLRFLALQLASAVEQESRTESRRMQMLEQQVTVLREESGRLKAALRTAPRRQGGRSRGPDLAARPADVRSVVENARLAAKAPWPLLPQPETPEKQGTAPASGRTPVPAETVFPHPGRMPVSGTAVTEIRTSSAPQGGPLPVPAAKSAPAGVLPPGEPKAAVSPMMPAQRVLPRQEPPTPENNAAQESRRQPLSADSHGRASAPKAAPSAPAPGEKAPSPASAAAASPRVPLGHTEPDERDAWKAPLPDPRPARLQRPEPARRILRTDVTERASTRQDAPAATRPPAPVRADGPRQTPETAHAVSASAARTDSPAPMPKPESRSLPTIRQQPSAAAQDQALSESPEPREGVAIRTAPLVHAAPALSPAAHSASQEEPRHSDRRDGLAAPRQEKESLSVPVQPVRSAAPPVEAASLVHAAPTPTVWEQRPGQKISPRPSAVPAASLPVPGDPSVGFSAGETGRTPLRAPTPASPAGIPAAQRVLPRQQMPPEQTAETRQIRAPEPLPAPASGLREGGGKPPDSLRKTDAPRTPKNEESVRTRTAEARTPDRSIRPEKAAAPETDLPARTASVPAMTAAPLLHRLSPAEEKVAGARESAAGKAPDVRVPAAISFPMPERAPAVSAPAASRGMPRAPSPDGRKAEEGSIVSTTEENNRPAARWDAVPLRTLPDFVRTPMIPRGGMASVLSGNGTVTRPEAGYGLPAGAAAGPALARTMADLTPPAVPMAPLAAASPVIPAGQTPADKAPLMPLPQGGAGTGMPPAIPAGSPAPMELRRTPVPAQGTAPTGSAEWQSDGIRTVHRTRTVHRETIQQPTTDATVRLPGETLSAPVSRTLGPAEVERIADKVYRQIEERLRSEKMRRGM